VPRSVGPYVPSREVTAWPRRGRPRPQTRAAARRKRSDPPASRSSSQRSSMSRKSATSSPWSAYTSAIVACEHQVGDRAKMAVAIAAAGRLPEKRRATRKKMPTAAAARIADSMFSRPAGSGPKGSALTNHPSSV